MRSGVTLLLYYLRTFFIHLLLEPSNLACLQLDSTADLEEVARRTEGFSCADLRSLCREAAMQPVRRLLKDIPEDSIEQAIDRSTVSLPGIRPHTLGKYAAIKYLINDKCIQVQ